MQNGTYTEPTEQLYTIKEAAEYLGMSTSFVYTRITKGILTPFELNGQRAVSAREIQALKVQHDQEIADLAATRMAQAQPTQIVQQEPKAEPIQPTQPEPTQEPSTTEGVNADEVFLLSSVIGNVFAREHPPITLTRLEEVMPTIRMWRIELQTLEGLKQYQVLYDGIQFTVDEV